MQFPGAIQGEAVNGFATANWDGGKMKLFKNDITPDATSKLADFVEADFSGYAESPALTSGDQFQGPDGKWKVLSQRVQFDHDGGSVNNTVFGFYVVKGAAPNTMLVGAHRFEVAEPMASAANAISLVVGLLASPAAEVFKQ